MVTFRKKRNKNERHDSGFVRTRKWKTCKVAWSRKINRCFEEVADITKFSWRKLYKTKDLRPTIHNKRKVTTTPYVLIRVGPDARLMRVTFTPLIKSVYAFSFLQQKSAYIITMIDTTFILNHAWDKCDETVNWHLSWETCNRYWLSSDAVEQPNDTAINGTDVEHPQKGCRLVTWQTNQTNRFLDGWKVTLHILILVH